MVYQTNFNPASPSIMHIDLNSCFASCEQQANPLLRNKPVAVVHSDAPYGCILAPSVEAKLWGVKTGMSLQEGKQICPFLIPRVADPPKYREVHHQLGELLSQYSDHVVSKSIDEFVLTLPSCRGDLYGRPCDPTIIASQIKSDIHTQVGDYLRVSIGISTNQNLAKLASGLHKPNGLDIIDSHNFLSIYASISLQDFCGINTRNEARLHRVGIFTPLDFYHASLPTLTRAFQSVLGRYWYTRLRGYEIDEVSFTRQSFGQSYVLPHPMTYGEWRPILAKLVSKAGRRLRASGYHATATHLYLRFANHNSLPAQAGWHTGHQLHSPLFRDCDLLQATLALYQQTCPPELKCRRVKKIAVTFPACAGRFGLSRDPGQLALLRDNSRDVALTHALDTLNNKWGEYSVISAAMMGTEHHVKDAIAFGK